MKILNRNLFKALKIENVDYKKEFLTTFLQTYQHLISNIDLELVFKLSNLKILNYYYIYKM